MKKNSAKRKLIPAAAMLCISAAMLATSTYAWFTMNKEVTAMGMKLEAKAESGLVISNAPSGNYSAKANSAITEKSELKPASTYDFNEWYYNTSTDPGDENTEDTNYTLITDETKDEHYVVHDFYIRSSSAQQLDMDSLNIKEVTVTKTGDGDLGELSKALRVGISFDGSTNKYIYNPNNGLSTYTVHKSTDTEKAHTQSVTTVSGKSEDNSINSVPSNTQAGRNVKVYLWFEGEDTACKSNNLVASLDELNVQIVFDYTEKT